MGQLQIWEAPTKRFTWKSRFVLFVPAVLGTTLLLILAAPLGQAQGTLDPAKVMNTRVTAECRASTKMAGRAAFMQTFPMLMQTVLNPELTTTPTPTCPLGTESSPQCLPSGCLCYPYAGGMTPTSGAPGTQVTICGCDFNDDFPNTGTGGVTGVLFGQCTASGQCTPGTTPAAFTIVSDSEAVATAPPGTGTVTVYLQPKRWNPLCCVPNPVQVGSFTYANQQQLVLAPQEAGIWGGDPSAPHVGAASGCAGDPCNTAFGTFSAGFDDVAVPGRGLTLSFSHVYNSIFAAVDGPLGFGWTHSYAMHLTEDPTTGAVTISQENGSQIIFNNSGSTYSPPSWVIATLVKNADGTFSFSRRAQQFFTFSSTGQLTSERDRNGYLTTLTYNGSGQLSTVTDPPGRSLTLAYSGSHLASVTDPMGRKISFAYDANGNLATVIDVAGGQTTFTYSPLHLLLTMTDPRGGVATNQYDSSNRVVSQSDQLGRTTSFSYAPGATTITDATGNVTQEQYNQLNERVSLTRGFGTSSAATWHFTYDPATIGISSVTDPNSHTSTTTYDSSGNPLRSTDGLGRVTARTWDTMNDLTSVTDPSGVTTTLSYDGNGNLLSRSRPLTGTSLFQTWTYQYSDANHLGDVTGAVDPDGNTTKYGFDSAGNLALVANPGNTTRFSYNAIGWRTALTDPRGQTRTYAYNSFGDLTISTDPLGHNIVLAYDPNRNLTTVTDRDGHLTRYGYDGANERTTGTRADGTTLLTVYNADSTVAKIIDGAGNATTYTYDPLARVISATDPLGRTTRYSYDGSGNQLTLTDPAGQVTTKSYDAANELVSLTYSDGITPNVSLTYDADRQRISMTDGTGMSTWIYDSLHRVISTTNGAGATVRYAYDLKGQLIGLTYPSSTHSVSRTYDAAGRLIAITDWLGNTTNFVYDPAGNLTTEIFPAKSRLTANFSYDVSGRLIGIVDSKGGTILASFDYRRDAADLLTGAAETGVPLSGQDTYTYTMINQLASVNASAYSYDAADNITGFIVPSQITLSYNAANELTTLTKGKKVTTFGYDARGNRLSRTPMSGAALTYSYNQANRMVAFGSGGTYSYDGDGLRMSKTVSGTPEAFTWDRSGALPLVLTDGGTNYIYDAQGLPLEQVSPSGAVLFFLHDQLGSMRLLANGSGVVQAASTYDAYGNLLAGALTTPFGYAGQYTDAESGLIYLRARYYDPATAQFVSRDPLDDMDPYAYVGGNPLFHTDPLGLQYGGPYWAKSANVGFSIRNSSLSAPDPEVLEQKLKCLRARAKAGDRRADRALKQMQILDADRMSHDLLRDSANTMLVAGLEAEFILTAAFFSAGPTGRAVVEAVVRGVESEAPAEGFPAPPPQPPAIYGEPPPSWYPPGPGVPLPPTQLPYQGFPPIGGWSF